MSFCSYSKEFAAVNFTNVENAFLYEYLPEATGNAVKVYLYGLFLCQNADFDIDLTSFAKELKLTADEVTDAFTYWEEFGLVTIVSREPFSVKYLPIGNTGTKVRKIKPEKYAAFTESAQALLPGRMIQPTEFNEYFSIMEIYGIKPEAFLMIIKYCADLKGDDIGYKYISAVAKDFGARKILTPEQVEKELSAYLLRTAELEKLLKTLSLRRKPEIDDLNYFNKWTKELGYEPETVLFAAKSLKKGSMKKLDEFLCELYARKVFSKKEIESYAETKKKLYDLAVKINKALGVYYETLDAVVDNYTAPWTAYGFDEESLLFIANYCFKKRKNTLENMDEIVRYFHKNGVIGYDAVAEYFVSLSEDEKFLSYVLAEAGVSRKPTAWDRENLKQWRAWNFSEEMIVEAARLAAGKNGPVPYMNAVLGSWKQKGIYTKEQIENAPLKNAGGTHFKNERAYTKEQLDKLIDDIDEIEI